MTRNEKKRDGFLYTAACVVFYIDTIIGGFGKSIWGAGRNLHEKATLRGEIPQTSTRKQISTVNCPQPKREANLRMGGQKFKRSSRIRSLGAEQLWKSSSVWRQLKTFKNGRQKESVRISCPKQKNLQGLGGFGLLQCPRRASERTFAENGT